jgi:hypothetical protein
MIDNFKLSSSVLLERLKDLEHYKEQAEQMKLLMQGSMSNMSPFLNLERP